jgi:peptide/nickel transport system substrate-binding protein
MRKMILLRGVAVAALCAVTLLTSCARAPTIERDVLRVGLVSLPTMPGNPFSSIGVPSIYTWAALFDSLTFVTADGRVLPWLATQWRQLDARTWEFALRRDVYFHNGVEFDARAVVFAVEYVTSEAARRESLAREMAGLEMAVAVDRYTVRIRAREPSPAMPSWLALLPIVEPGAWQRLGREGFSQAPVGTGPYRLIRWRRDGADLQAAPRGWRPARLGQLQLRVIPDSIARVQALQSNAIDVAVSLGPDDQVLLAQSGARLDFGPSASVLGLTFVLTRLRPGHPLLDRRVRQALNHAIDKQAYVQAIFGGRTRIATQPGTAAVVGFDSTLPAYEYDPARARSLLAEAGFADGFTFAAEIAIGAGAADAAVYQQVAADLRRVNVDLRLLVIPLTQFVTNVQNNSWSHEAFGMNYNAERSLDALRFTRLHSCLARRPWYCDSKLTPLIAEAQRAADGAERARLVGQVMRRYRDEAPAIWLHEIAYVQGVARGIGGFAQHNSYILYERLERAASERAQ